MAKQTGRSLRLSRDGVDKANIALTKFGSVADLAAQIGAARKRTRGASPKTTVGMSRGTIYKFLKGKPVQRKEFHEICTQLELNWKEVADLSGINQHKAANRKQGNSSDVDELVREARSLCCDKVQHLYSKIQLLNRQQIDIDKLYVDVYMLKKLASDSHATIPGLLRGSDLGNDFDRFGLGQRGERSPGFEIAADYPRLMVLGKPGSGKSTFLRHLAVACCKAEFQAGHIPILIELRDIKDASHFDLLNKIHKEFRLANQAQTEQILNQGKVLILLDGLDEVPGQSRQDVQDHIYEFCQQYYKNRFILTCRTQTTEYTLSTFDYVEVAEFKPDQVEIFAQNWFTALAEKPEQGAELTVNFLDKLRLPENKPTAELAVTPILLSLTCWVFNDLKDLHPKRSDLYEQGINLLLEKWDEKRGVRRDLGSEAYQKLSIEEKKKLLSYLAARKLEQEQYVLFEQGELQGYIAEYLGISTEDSEAVVDAVAALHGLLIERAQGFWSFSHLTFQEYFTAKWFCDRDDLEGLAKHVREKHWREVLLLAIDMLPSADRLLDLMKQRVDKLVAIDEELQKFLTEVNQTSLKFKTSCKRADVRAYYLNPARDSSFIPTGARNLNLSNTFDFDRIHDSNDVLNLAHDLDHIHDLARGFVLAPVVDQTFFASAHPNHNDYFNGHVSGIASGYKHGPSRAVNGERMYRDNSLTWKFDTEQFKHDLAQEVSKLTHDLTRNLTYTLSRTMFLHDLTLKQTLQDLTNQLPDLDSDTYKWWKAEGQAWTRQLIEAMIEHCHVGHAWRFRPEQKELLNQYYDYYDANKLLVDCLNSGCNISDDVRNEIEETLLLPIDEIKKR